MLTCTFICNPIYTCNVLLSTRGIGDTTRDHVGPWQEIEFQLMFESDYGWIGCVISHPSGSRSRTFLRTFCRKGTEPIQADPTTQGWAPDLFGSQSCKTTSRHVAKPRLPSFLYSNVDKSSISVEGVPAFRWVRIRIKSVP